ncbi:MAG: hypothetical protein QM736_26250 [Vicinamibacterales bacterium]
MTPPKRSLRELLATKGASTRQPWQELILRKCALLREFDETLFDKVLADDVPAGKRFPFSALTQMPEVVPVPGNPEAFYIRGESRSTLLGAWESDPDGLRDFSRRMWLYYEDGSPLDRLAQMLFASSRDALTFARTLYDEADRSGDLSSCDAQLRILRNRSELLSQFAPDLFRFLQDREQYLRSRVLFVEDWTRSRHYLERPSITAAADAFLALKDTWLLQTLRERGLRQDRLPPLVHLPSSARRERRRRRAVAGGAHRLRSGQSRDDRDRSLSAARARGRSARSAGRTRGRRVAVPVRSSWTTADTCRRSNCCLRARRRR